MLASQLYREAGLSALLRTSASDRRQINPASPLYAHGLQRQQTCLLGRVTSAISSVPRAQTVSTGPAVCKIHSRFTTSSSSALAGRFAAEKFSQCPLCPVISLHGPCRLHDTGQRQWLSSTFDSLALSSGTTRPSSLQLRRRVQSRTRMLQRRLQRLPRRLQMPQKNSSTILQLEGLQVAFPRLLWPLSSA